LEIPANHAKIGFGGIGEQRHRKRRFGEQPQAFGGDVEMQRA